MLATVVPKIVGVFQSTSAELPGLTRGLITVSDFLRDHWFALIIGLGAVFYAIWWVLQRDGPRRAYHRFLLRMPITGRLTRGINTARFTRTLSILAGSGVPILEAMKISAEVVENLPMRDALGRAAAGQEREVDGLIATLLGILQPLVIVLMGGVVLTIVLAILLPIFEINNLIR